MEPAGEQSWRVFKLVAPAAVAGGSNNEKGYGTIFSGFFLDERFLGGHSQQHCSAEMSFSADHTSHTRLYMMDHAMAALLWWCS